ASIELHFEQRCVDFDPAAGVLRLRDERSRSVRDEPVQSLLAADGAGSALRCALVDRGLTRVDEAPLDHDYKELLIAPDSEGYVFEPRALHIWPRGGFMLIALPNADGSFTATLFLPMRGPESFETLTSPSAIERFFSTHFADVYR